MMKLYKPKLEIGSLIWVLATTLIAVTMFGLVNLSAFSYVLISFLTIFPIYLYFIKPKYSIIGQELSYKGPDGSGKINIQDIQKIETNKLPPSFPYGIFFNPYRKGFIVYYNKMDDIFISIKDEDILINELIELNPGIQMNH